MKPQTVLKIKPEGKTAEEIYAVRDIWIREYEKYIRENPEHEELGARLIDRVKRAAQMLVKRYVGVPAEPKNEDDGDFDWDDYNPVYKEENDSLDGAFPLGNAYDANFITPYFTIENLVRIQFGETTSIHTGHYVEPAYDVLVRKGFIYELMGEWAEAEHCYGGVPLGRTVLEREFDCRRKKEVAGENAYAEAQWHMESGEWSRVYTPLQRAVDMQHPDAMVDMGLALIYGQFGISTDYNEGLELLRRAATWHNSARACMEIVELYDNGADVEGSEAEELCKKAADAGDKKAIARLEDGFDTRPLAEILLEQAEKGNGYAMWWLYNNALKHKNFEEAQMWYDNALEAGYPDVLFAEAETLLQKDSENYNKELAVEYLLCAADKGYIRAIIGLAELELCEGDEPFWRVAMKKNEPEFEVNAELLERHKRQFEWFKLAADEGDADSANALAVAYHFGYPVERDDKEAFRRAEYAAEEKNTPAMYQAAYFLENGFGCEKDIDRAVEYYKCSAEEGIMASILRLYEIYRDGLEHIPADKSKANRYLWLSGIGRD